MSFFRTLKSISAHTHTHKKTLKLHEPPKQQVKSENCLGASSRGEKIVHGPPSGTIRGALLLLCTFSAFALRADQTEGFTGRSLIKHTHTHTHTTSKARAREGEKEEERKEREGCV